MAGECGYCYYHSNMIVGNEGHKTMCTWIDQDHTLPITKSSALQIHTEDFTYLTNQSKINEDPTFYCNLPAILFKYHHNYVISRLSLSRGIQNAKSKLIAFISDKNVYVKNRKLVWNDYTIWTGHEEFDALPPLEERSLGKSDPRPVAE